MIEYDWTNISSYGYTYANIHKDGLLFIQQCDGKYEVVLTKPEIYKLLTLLKDAGYAQS